MTYLELSEILFPDVKETTEDIEKLYPNRSLEFGAEVTRFGASPTGLINIGGLYTAFISYKIAKDSNGLFILRIEDNNRRDYVDGGIKSFVNALKSYEITFDEGYFDNDIQIGSYGPYIQSQRERIYKVFVKQLVATGVAYPCFCSVEKIEQLRQLQRSEKKQTGYYGEYAECSKLSSEQAAKKVMSGEHFVIRVRNKYLKAYNEEYYYDLIKGKVKLCPTNNDLIILKETGIPDYNFAHVCDDHLMGTTTITRCEDWLPSLHTHLALFALMGWKAPKYAHIGALSLKLNESSVVKISKSLGEIVTVEHYIKKGYPVEALKTYFSIIATANYENNKLFNNNEKLEFRNMSKHGPIFDIDKLNSVSKNVLELMDADIIKNEFCNWLKRWYPKEEKIIMADDELLFKVIKVLKGIEKPRKSLICYEDILRECLPFYLAPHKDKIELDDTQIFHILLARFKNSCPNNNFDMRVLLEEVAEVNDVKLARVCSAVRHLILGSDVSPSIIEIMTELGGKRIIKLIENINVK